MNIQKQFQLRHFVLLAGVALWSAATPVAAQDAPSISVSDATVVKPTGAAQSADFIVSRSGDTSFPVTVGYRTQDGTAKAGVDYAASYGVVAIPAGATSTSIQVPVLRNQKSTPQNFVLRLTGASGPLGFTISGDDPVLEARVIDIEKPLTDVIPGDFNGDGRIDLVGKDADGHLSLLLNRSESGVSVPTFEPAIDLGPGFPRALGDFNADGRTDIVIADAFKLFIALNLAIDGSSMVDFSSRTGPLGGAGASAVADFNGDGKDDIFVCSTKVVPVAPGIPPAVVSSVLLNTTTADAVSPSFVETSDIQLSCDTVAATDLNDDGSPDVVVGGEGQRLSGRFVSVARNLTDRGALQATFLLEPFSAPNSTVPNFTLGDFDGDGRPEVAVGGGLSINRGPAGGPFEFEQSAFLYEYLFTERVSSTTGDFDGDGRTDILFNGQLFLNATASGASSPSFTKSIISNIPLNPFETLSGPFETADLNGDGKPELIGRSVLTLPVQPAQLSKSQGTATIQPNADTTPQRFSFLDRFGVARSQPQVSNAILVRGINQPAPIMVNGGSYSINNGPYVTSPGLAKNGDRVRVALFAPSQFNTAANAQLIIGGVSDVFTARTRGPLLDVFLSRLFGFEFLNQFEIAMAGFNAPAMQ